MWHQAIVCLAMIASVASSSSKRRVIPDPLPAKILYDHLMGQYKSMIRPDPPENKKFAIKLALRLSQINFVDEREQILSLSVWLRQEWHDSRLMWNPEEHQGVKILNVPSDEIWIPDLVLYNNADGDFQVTLRTKALVYHTGTVVWEPPAIYKSYCPIDVEFFPFDLQECFLKFSSWTYHGNEVDLQHICNGTALNPESDTPEMIIPRGIDLSAYYYNTEWDILNVTATRRVKFYSCCPDPFPDVTFNLTLRRRPLFYTLNLVMPCIAFLGLTVLVFYLPTASGEKVSLAISILLALTLFFLILTEMNPPTSLVVPLLGKYLLFIFLVVAMSVITTVTIVHVNLKSPSTDTMSPWIRRIFVEILPRLLFMGGPQHYISSKQLSRKSSLLSFYGNDTNDTDDPPKCQNKPSCFGNNLNSCLNKIRGILPRMNNMPTYEIPMTRIAEPTIDGNTDQSTHPKTINSHRDPSSAGLPPDVLEALSAATWISSHLNKADEDLRERRDWVYIGIVLDRLFLYIFGFACLIGTFTIFMSAPSLYDPREHMTLTDSNNACIY